MAIKDEAMEAVGRALRLSGSSQVEAIERAFPDRPLLRTTLTGLLADSDTSWLETAGAWNPRFEERIRETLEQEPLAIGERVGDIRIRGQLGTGGMGTVYLGFDERLEREVAVKTVRIDGRQRPLARERFEREAGVLSRLNHPAICQIYSLVDARSAGQEIQCLVLERVEGTTLRESVGELGPDERLRVLEQVARALAVAHREGIIHRDLKPDNVMLTPAGEVKILDFGIARFSDAGSPEPVEEGDDGATARLVGTPRYMSPEQALCEPLSPASDLYSLGLLLKEVVTGSPAHPSASSPYELIRRAAEAEVEPLDESVDAEIAELVHGLLARDPAERPTAEETADRIRWVLDRPARARRRRIRWALGSVTALALIAAVWASVSAWQARRDADRLSVAARQLGEEVRSVDNLLRAAHLAPPHDVRAERRWVENRLRWIEEEFGGAGTWAEAPVAYARGKIALALGRPDEARMALERGWELGYHDRKLAEALGLAFGLLFDEASADARRLATADQRRAALEVADQSLRVPAVEWLDRARTSGSARGADGDPNGLAEAWIALYENRFDDARNLADRAFDEAPWLYEALRIRGLASLREAAVLEEAGQSGEAEPLLRQAEAAFERALSAARSDPELHLERCRLGNDIITNAYRIGQEGQQPYQRAVETCRDARSLLPDDPEPWLAEASLEYFLAWSRSETLRDPIEALNRLRVAAERALELAPESAEAFRLLGLEASERGEWAGSTGRSGRSDFERAQALLRRAVELQPDSSSQHYALGTSLFSLGFEEMFQGEDPRTTLQEAADSLRHAQRLSPGSYSAPSMMGSTYGVMAMYSLEHGLDPLEHLRRSIGAFEQALEIEPGAPAPRGNLAMAYRDLATYHWLLGSAAAEVDDAVEKGRRAAESLIEDKPDSVVRITLGELELLCARSLLDRGLDAADRLDRVDGLAEELKGLGVVGTGALRLQAESLYLRARSVRDQSEVVDVVSHRARAATDEWIEAGGGHAAWALKGKIALQRAEVGLSRDVEIRRGLEAVDKALEIRPGWGDAYLLKARLLALAGEASAADEAVRLAIERNPWLARQARSVEAVAVIPAS
ncbi:MAG: protein kinase [Thermoanaerobaculia bacterium]|nr:protein kinase [Thermoanaerobaculia bacterium]